MKRKSGHNTWQPRRCFMSHSKSFPREVKGNTQWQEVYLTLAEDQQEEERARKENLSLMKQCVEDATTVMRAKNLQTYQSDMVAIAVTLFAKRASHTVYWKDRKCKEKFDQQGEVPRATRMEKIEPQRERSRQAQTA